jgi:DNA-binding MurR/RpiR family transcriptional regulator
MGMCVETLEGFRQRLGDRFEALTTSQKRIASFLAARYDEAAFLPAAALAERLNVSEATVVRFARAVGYRGFPEMRHGLQDLFRLRVNPATRLRRKLDELKTDQRHVLSKTINMEVQCLTEALESVRPEDLDRAVKIVLTSARVFVFGLGPARVLADLAKIRLQRFGIPTVSMTQSGRDVLEDLLILSNRDAVLATGFLRATRELVTVLDYARATGASVVLLTDTLGLALRSRADVVLAARRGPVSTFHSMTVPMAILNALLLAVAGARPRQSLRHVGRLQTLRTTSGLDLLADEERHGRRARHGRRGA